MQVWPKWPIKTPSGSYGGEKIIRLFAEQVEGRSSQSLQLPGIYDV
jgi:hypothetical protein